MSRTLSLNYVRGVAIVMAVATLAFTGCTPSTEASPPWLAGTLDSGQESGDAIWGSAEPQIHSTILFSQSIIENKSETDPLVLDSVELTGVEGLIFKDAFLTDLDHDLGNISIPLLKDNYDNEAQFLKDTYAWEQRSVMSGYTLQPGQAIQMLLQVETDHTGCDFALGFIIHYTQFGYPQTATGKNPFLYYDATPIKDEDREKNAESCEAKVRDSRGY